MSQQQFDPYNQPVQPTEYAANPNPGVAPTEYAAANPYAQPAPNPYDQPQPITNPYSQPQPVANPYAQPAPNPYGQPVASSYAPPQYAPMPALERGRGQALAGLILGIIGMVTWIIPYIGLPVSIVGFIMAILGRRSISRKGMALAGLILGIIGLVLSLAACAFDIYALTAH